MFSNQGARMSVDSLSPTLQTGPRDFPFHGKSSRTHSPQRPSHHRRGSTASSIHSVGGSLDTAAGTWNQAVLETGQNAISTLLQPPIVRTGLVPHTTPPTSSTHKPPTARDIPPVTLTNIPHVDASEFKPYLSQVGALYEQLRRVQAEEEDAATGGAARRISKADSLAEAMDDGHRLRPGKRPGAVSRRTSTASISSISSFEAPSPVRRSGANLRRSGAHGPPPLSTIPTVYFDQDFHLENPRIFDVVSERSEVIRSTSGADDRAPSNGHAEAPRKALATNAILQEKLSWYMDTIEMHLIQSISTASTTFFTALGSLRELHSEAAESVERIKTLRKELESLDEEIAARGLDIVQQRRRRENIQQLYDAVEQLREVVERLRECESLVDAGEVDNALDSIDALERLIAGEQGSSQQPRQDMQLRDLRGTSALQSISTDLDTLRHRVGEAYESKFLSTLAGDLRRHVEKVSRQEVLMRWNSASIRSRGGHGRDPSAFPSYLASIDDLREALLPSLTGLQRAKHLTAAASAYRETTLKEVRNIIKQPLPSSNDDDAESMMSSSTMTGGKQRTPQEKAIGLARNLRALEPRDAEEIFIKIYIGVAETLRRLSTQAKVLLDVASSIGDPSGLSDLKSPIKSPPFSPTGRRPSNAALEAQEEIHKALDISNLLGQAVDIAQERIVRVLRARSSQSTRLSLIWFLRYFTLNLHFAIECEAISGRSGTRLKDEVNAHIKEFVTQHKDAELQKLVEGMNSDQWISTDFTEKDSELLEHILEGSTKNDSTWWTRNTKMWVPHGGDEDDENQDALPDDAAAKDAAASKAKSRGAIIDEETFHLPKSAILCMNGIGQFLHLIVGMPSVATDISSSLIAYLSFFASRCYQLILAAGATLSAGLRYITTINLAVASRALGFIATLIPHIREFVRRYCGAGGNSNVSAVMAEYDKVRRVYQEHQNSIYDKLVEIMHRRAQVGAKSMRALDWEAEGGKPVHDYMETLAKETARLHRNLVKQQLPEDTIRMIMLPIFNSYKETFGAVLGELNPETEAGRDSMIRDVEYLQSRLGKMDGFEGVGEHLIDIIKSKVVKSKATPHTLAQAQFASGGGGDGSGQNSPSPVASPSPQEQGENGSAEGRKASGEGDAASGKFSGEGQRGDAADG